MGFLEVKKEEIIDWDYGDVKLKTFSFGESLKINSWIKPGQSGEDAVFKDGVSEDDAGVFLLAAGIHFVRTIDGTDFWIKPNTPVDEKIKKLYNVSVRSGAFLTKKIGELNKGMSDAEKKV